MFLFWSVGIQISGMKYLPCVIHGKNLIVVFVMKSFVWTWGLCNLCNVMIKERKYLCVISLLFVGIQDHKIDTSCLVKVDIYELDSNVMFYAHNTRVPK